MNQQPKKSSKIWIVLGVISGFFLLMIGVCCGAGLWLTRFPRVPASASQAFDYGTKPKQIFSAGHSSAGTTALLFAEHEPRLAGCIAFAPCTDLKARISGALVKTLSFTFDGLPEFLVKSSPRTHEMRINCPVMLFHAADDSNVPIGESRAFASRLQSAGKDVTLKEVATGDHYQPMIDTGIPTGIEWIKQHLK